MKPSRVARTVTVILPLLCGMMPGQVNLVKNGDFENFSGNEPTGWSTSNIPKALTVVSPSLKCHSGKSAVKCEVKDFYGSKVAGMIMQKNIRIRGAALRLSGYYLLNSLGRDAGFVAIELQNDEGSTVKVCQENLVNSPAGFARFSVTGDIPREAVRLDLKLSLLPGEGSEKLHEGSYILFDDLELVPVAAEGEKKQPGSPPVSSNVL